AICQTHQSYFRIFAYSTTPFTPFYLHKIHIVKLKERKSFLWSGAQQKDWERKAEIAAQINYFTRSK
ncbi:hypothetical protein, partial [Kaistella yonginensis]|uniref:hypothetical protein n=1 Tax=Kaistella yonginensis TaxID=658267 RepID=UPI0025B34818